MIERFCDWLNATSLSTAFQTWTWFVPLVQTVHILCVAAVFVAVLRVGVRLLHAKPDQGDIAHFLEGFMPVIWAAMTVLLISGTLLTITEPSRELLNWVFRTKMILVLLLLAVVLGVRRSARRDPTFGSVGSSRVAARAAAILLMGLGVAIITAGRWIAYV